MSGRRYPERHIRRCKHIQWIFGALVSGPKTTLELQAELPNIPAERLSTLLRAYTHRGRLENLGHEPRPSGRGRPPNRYRLVPGVLASLSTPYGKKRNAPAIVRSL